MQIVIALLTVLFRAVLPVLFELREKSREAIEVVPDPAADAEFWAGEWMS
jgi:hypothetical protein